jgi:hypothetical protein
MWCLMTVFNDILIPRFKEAFAMRKLELKGLPEDILCKPCNNECVNQPMRDNYCEANPRLVYNHETI